MTSASARDRQMEILTEAVAALRQEIARSYAYSDGLVEETKKLHVQITSLKRELGESKQENQALKNQIRTLEKRLREIRTPPPEGAAGPAPATGPPGDGAAAASPAPTPPSAATNSPAPGTAASGPSAAPAGAPSDREPATEINRAR